MRALGILALLAVAPVVSHAETPAEVFQQGQALGASGGPPSAVRSDPGQVPVLCRTTRTLNRSRACSPAEAARSCRPARRK